MNKLRFVLTLLLPLVLPCSSFAAGRPNIILILMDDMGYECIGANGGTSYRTPVIDKLAATGVRFEHCYVQPLCTPTGVQLMTGIYNVLNYLTIGEMDKKAVTFANLLKPAGHRTNPATDSVPPPRPNPARQPRMRRTERWRSARHRR